MLQGLDRKNSFLLERRWKGVLLNPPTSDPPTTDHRPTDYRPLIHRPNDPPTQQPNNERLSDKILFKKLENREIFILQNT